MAIPNSKRNEQSETKYSTKRVFMRAEYEDILKITNDSMLSGSGSVPETAIVIQRDMTYYGPKIRIESRSDNEQYLLTAPGPETEAVLWEQIDNSWQKLAEVSLDFQGAVPKYDICPYCNEPLSTIAHQRRSAIGACKND